MPALARAEYPMQGMTNGVNERTTQDNLTKPRK